MSEDLKELYKAGFPVEGLDFSWTSNSQDADPGWEKTARFAVVPGPTGQTTVRVTFRNGGRDSEIRYLMVQEKGKWAVDDIRFVGGDNLQLSQMLTRGAQEKP